MKNSIEKKENKASSFLIVLSMIFVIILLVSNISASNVLYSNDFFSLSAAEFLFPISYVVSDLLCEFFSFKKVNKIVVLGLSITFLATVILFLTTLFPSGYSEYQTVFGFFSSGVIGITIASFLAYAVGTLTNSYIMSKFKAKDKNKKFFKRAIISSIVAEIFDSLVFITFCCIFASQFYFWDKLFSLVVTISLIKIAVEIIVFPLTNYLRKLAIKKNWVEPISEESALVENEKK